MPKPMLLAALIVSGLVLAGCSSSGDGSGASATTAPTAPTTIPLLTAPTTPTTAGQKVNANTASQAEIAAALAAHGVDNATRWAGEVVEYRPYPTNDPSFAKLRQNLAKYNPSGATVDNIVASLSL